MESISSRLAAMFLFCCMFCCCMPSSAQAQKIDTQTAGDHLKKAGDDFLYGLYYSALGGGIMMLSNLSSMHNSDPRNDRDFRTAVTVTGGACICFGVVCHVLGCVELSKAGKKMNGINLGASADGVTIKMKF